MTNQQKALQIAMAVTDTFQKYAWTKPTVQGLRPLVTAAVYAEALKVLEEP